ncbi:DUF3105 domain-containing protein [Nocardioides sp. MAHUQ-72]|uniref:DUF3105 domain-containing protein n=1 Tax=unclassified Nocardioides TaxID=2615069 RepID=UPI00361F3D43
MAKKPAKSDRQAVIDQIRKKQKGGERRRGLAIVGVCVLIAVLIVGAAAFKPIKDWYDNRKFDKLALTDIGSPASSCEKIVTKKANGNQDHVPTGTKVDYKQAPPAFGAHWNQAGVAPAPMERKLYTDDRPELESLVHNLEHGYTILWYDKTVADDDGAMSDLRAIASKFEGTSNFRDKFIAAPWTSADENGKTFPDGQHVALTHWSAGGTGQSDASKQVGVWQYCSGVSGEALQTFMDKYPYFDSPEPSAM